MKKYSIFKIGVVLSIVMGINACKTTQKVDLSESSQEVVEQPLKQQPAVMPPKANLTETTPTQLASKKWTLVYMVPVDVTKVNYDNEKPYVVFDSVNMAIKGNSGCNSFGGNVELGNNTIKVGMMLSTKKYCMDIPEPEFLTTLEKCVKYEIVNNELKFYDMSDQLMMRFSGMDK